MKELGQCLRQHHCRDSHNLLLAPALPWMLLKRRQEEAEGQINCVSKDSLSLFAVLPRKLLISCQVTMLQELQNIHGSSELGNVVRARLSADKSGQQGGTSALILHILLSFHTHARPHSKHAKRSFTILGNNSLICPVFCCLFFKLQMVHTVSY